MCMLSSLLFKKTFFFTILTLFISNVAFLQSPAFVITGKVTGYDPVGTVKDVTLVYGGVSTDITLGSDGSFSFTTLDPTPQNLEINNAKDYLNGINVGDIIKIQNHILGKNKLEKGNKLIAADVSKNGNILVSDILPIRRIILGKSDKFNSGKSWTFIDEKFPLEINNFGLAPDFITVDPNNPGDIHFKAIKLGDVDLNAKAEFSSGLESRNDEVILFKLNDFSFKAGNQIDIPVTSTLLKNIAGIQGVFTYDRNTLEFLKIKSGAIQINPDDFYNNTVASTLTFLNSELGADINENEVLFTLVFQARANKKLSEVLNMKSNQTPSMVVTEDNEQIEIHLEFNNEVISENKGFDMSQNKPNPFTTSTEIHFNLLESGPVLFNVFDVTGKVIFSKIIQGEKGSNSLIMSKDEINSTGVFFYQLNSGSNSILKKMVCID